MTLANLALTFALSGIVVITAGTVLARNGDIIAAATNLGGLWVGSVFLALATSLPEIVTDIAAIRLGAPDLAAGDLFGSSMANMLILALIAVLPAGQDLFRKATLDHALYASLAMILTAIAAIAILVRPGVSLLGVGYGSIALVVTYVIGSRAIFRYTALAQRTGETVEMSGNADIAVSDESKVKETRSLRRAIVMFVGAALVILLAAPQFAKSAEGISEITGIGSTFMGTWLVGLATSLPELVTSLAAVRLRAYDLAVGNLFGSNALNMTIFAVLDAVQGTGPVLSLISPVHAISALIAIVLMGIAIGAVVYRAKGRLALLEPSGALIIVVYMAGLGLVFLRSAGS